MKKHSPKRCALAAAATVLVIAGTVSAGPTSVIGGTSVIQFDVGALAAAGLSPSSGGPGVGGPFTFTINPRDAAVRPTTFTYDSDAFTGSTTGRIEHTGSLAFNDGAVTTGELAVAYDPARAVGGRSGMYLTSGAGTTTGPLFDLVLNAGLLNATESALTVGAELLLAPELGTALTTAGLATTDAIAAVAGRDLGDLQVNATAMADDVTPPPAAVPLPAAVAMGLVTLAGVGGSRVLARVRRSM